MFVTPVLIEVAAGLATGAPALLATEKPSLKPELAPFPVSSDVLNFGIGEKSCIASF